MTGQIEGRTNPARISAVDGLRGVLALVVVAWHATPNGPAWMLMLANLAVTLFFVVSGYVLARGWNGRFGLFLARRLVRLWPVYALCLGAGYLIAGQPPVLSEFLWFPLIGANTRPFIDPPVWSLFLEVWTMPFMLLIVWAGAGRIWRAGAVMGGLIAASHFVPQLGVGVLFVAGAYFSRSEFRNRLLESWPLQALGRISYSLYLSHWLVIALAMRLMGPWGGAMALPAVLVVAAGLWWGVERPSIAASRRLGRLLAAVSPARWPGPRRPAAPAPASAGPRP